MSKLEKWFLIFCILSTGAAFLQTNPAMRIVLFIIAIVDGVAFIVAPKENKDL